MNRVIDRRSLIAGAAALALPIPASARSANSLAALGAANGIRFGSTVGKRVHRLLSCTCTFTLTYQL